MSSRQDEKQRRRREREEAERRANAAAARSRRIQMVGGIVMGIAVVAVAFILIRSGGGSDAPATTAAATDVALPARKISNLEDAAKAGGCTVRSFPSEGRDHVTTKVTTYKTNPPTSGPHHPVPAEDGIYAPGNAPQKEHFVHSLEHGRIEFQYRPGAPQKTIETLTAIFNEPVNGTPGYHALLFENTTGMKPPIVATAWTRMITCNDLNPAAIDALRDFRERYTDKGPEFIP